MQCRILRNLIHTQHKIVLPYNPCSFPESCTLNDASGELWDVDEATLQSLDKLERVSCLASTLPTIILPMAPRWKMGFTRGRR